MLNVHLNYFLVLELHVYNIIINTIEKDMENVKSSANSFYSAHTWSDKHTQGKMGFFMDGEQITGCEYSNISKLFYVC